MAFVFQKEREFDRFHSAVPEHLGPGSYVGHQDFTVPSYNTQLGIRKPVIEKNLTIQDPSPGPGTYNIQSTIANEKIVASSDTEDIKILEIP